MNADEIKNALKEKGFSVRMLAEVSKLEASSISVVINRHQKSRPVAEMLSKATGISVAKLFPDVPEYTSSSLTPLRGQKRELKKEELRNLLAS